MIRSITCFLQLVFAICSSLLATAQYIPANGNRYSTSCQSYPLNKLIEINPVTSGTHRKIFAQKAVVYCSPDLNSQILDTLTFATPVHLLELVNRYRPDTIYLKDGNTSRKKPYELRYKKLGQWYKIARPDTSGFIKLETVSLETYEYFGFLAGYDSLNNDRAITLHSFNKAEPNQIKHRYRFKNLSHGYKLNTTAFNGLQNSGQLIIYRTFRESCPGATWYEFVLLNQNDFIPLVSSFSTGEAGEFEIETIYLPMKFENGKVLLVGNADLENIFNYQTGGLHTYDYPKNLKVPIEQLIVRTREYTEPVLDKNGEPIMIDDYEVKVKVIKEKPKFYKWDGVKLREIK